jgi:hypothetical protein
MNRQPHVDAILRCGAFVAGLLLASVAPAVPGAEATPPPAPGSIAGEFTGELSHGGPVYRLPAVQVIAHRKTELVRTERDERMRQTGVKTTQPAV